METYEKRYPFVCYKEDGVYARDGNIFLGIR